METIQMEKVKKLVPELRFRVFDGDWEIEKFGKLATNKSGKFNPIKEKTFTKCIELEHLGTETGQLLGFIDGSNSGSIKNKFSEGDILFGKLRPYLKKYLLAPFEGVCSSEIWVLQGVKVINPFLYRIVQTDKFIDLANQSSGSKMPRADWNVVENGIFSFPSLPEQQKIASFLSAVDEKIQLFTRKKELLEHYKKGAMQQVFSKKLRFKDENGKDFPDWEEKRLGDVTYKVGKKNKENVQYPIYSINNQEGFRPQSEQFDGLDSNERGYDISMYKIVQSETFAYNPARINVGSIGYSYNLDNVIISSLYVCFKTKKDLDDLFLLAYLETFTFKKDILRFEEGGVRQYLFFENFSHIKIPIPSIKEQQKIASFLSAIDEKIEAVNQQITQSQTFKKGLLQQMFV